MTRPSGKRQTVSALLIAAGLIVFGAAALHAQTLQEAACYIFEGDENCRTVAIVDPDSCIIKVRPRPLADLDPEIAGCLLDDIDTKQVFLRKVRPENLIVSNRMRVSGKPELKSTLEIAGDEVVQVLTNYDENGAPVWKPQDSYTFELKGDPIRTRKALEHLSSNVCAGQRTAAAGQMPLSEAAIAAGQVTPRVIGVNEAFKLADAGNIVLIDIRQESEWRKTGVGVNAIPITMHQSMKDFVDQLNRATGPNNQRPIALICASGVRSSYLQRELGRYGFSRVIDVHEGMLGSPQGPGWIKAGLPTRPYAPPSQD